MAERRRLTDEERTVYEWQLWVSGFGEAGQERLKGATVLVSRVGGVGGCVAYQLAAAGVGKLLLAHGGAVVPSYLNRQLLMTHDALGTPRVESAARRLRGRRTMTSVPMPTVERMRMVPPCSSVSDLAMARPSPEP